MTLIKLKNNTFDLLLLGLIFVCLFIIPGLLFNIPIQGDDFWGYNYANFHDQGFTKFPEFKRSVVSGFFLYKLYQISGLFKQSMNTNAVFFLYYTIHFINASFLYTLLKKITKTTKFELKLNLPFWSALIFLVQQPAIECYSNIANGLRLIGPLFILLFLINQLYQLNYVSKYRIIISMILSYLSFDFYEANIYFLGLSFFLPLTRIGQDLAQDMRLKATLRKSFFIKWMSYYMSLLLSILPSLLTFLLNGTKTLSSKSSEHVINYISIVKKLIYYLAQNTLPNLHGSLFICSLIYLFCIVLMTIISLKFYKHFSRSLRTFVGILIAYMLLFIFIISSFPHFAPRLLYSNMLVYAIVIALLVNAVLTIRSIEQNKFWAASIKFALFGIILSSVVNIFHFFVLQHQTHAYFLHVKEKLSQLGSSRGCLSISINCIKPDPVRIIGPIKSKNISPLYHYVLSFTDICHTVTLNNTYPLYDVNSNIKSLLSSKLFNAFYTKPIYEIKIQDSITP